MSIWALSDPHLAVSTPLKDMAVFGPSWEDYMEKMAFRWNASVKEEDLVLIPGDISWARNLEEAKIDLNWIHELPGAKVIIKGNHDYWWGSGAKMNAALPSSVRFIHNNALVWNDVAVGGTRLWDTDEYNFAEFIQFRENPKARKEPIILPEENAKIFEKELKRLELSLSLLDKKASFRIALTHYPPIGADLAPSEVSSILEKFKIDVCVFGHLHSIKPGALPFGKMNGVRYVFASADYLEFAPIKIR